MWTILKFDKKNPSLLKENLMKKLGKDLKLYHPKILVQKYKNNKLINKEFDLLGDYIFCYHKAFKNPDTLKHIQYTPGLKYCLNGFSLCQKQIVHFIDKCKLNENSKGYLTTNFIQVKLNSFYKFSSGPFTNTIFKIIQIQKNKLEILLGNFKTSIKEKEYLFRPV